MEKQGVPLKGDLTVDNVREVFSIFLGGRSQLVHCMTSRKDVEGEPTFHFSGLLEKNVCDTLKLDFNEGFGRIIDKREKRRFTINIPYIFDGVSHIFRSFGKVLHWTHIYSMAYEIQCDKLIIKYFCRGSKSPSSFLVFQIKKSDAIQIFRNRNDKNIKKVVNLLENKRMPFISIFTDEDSCMLVPGITYTIRKIEDMIEYIDFLQK
jgi:hypothetical protein